PPFFAILRYSSKIVTVSAVPPRERIGAKNSTCTRFGKGFSALLVAEKPFFQGFFVSGLRSERRTAVEQARHEHARPRARCSDFRCGVRRKSVFRNSDADARACSHLRAPKGWR
ncbi:MAG TPA: hypothetical protein VN676_10815, partial [Steroidobacteraceae bacterium]|nr:hypothetical protein [Steroidobacteraceae bacterium]